MYNKSVILEKHSLLVISCQGKKRDHIFQWFKKGMRKMLPNNVKPQTSFTGRKVFQINDKSEMKHDHDMILYGTRNAQCRIFFMFFSDKNQCPPSPTVQ